MSRPFTMTLHAPINENATLDGMMHAEQNFLLILETGAKGSRAMTPHPKIDPGDKSDQWKQFNMLMTIK
jgi:hypothetical protein